MFGIGGERDLSERELPHLEGWRHSTPVRIGNAAWKQGQLDVYGELLNAVYRMSDHLFDNTHRVRPMSNSGRWDTPRDLAPASTRESSCNWPTPPFAGGRRRTKESGRSGGAA